MTLEVLKERRQITAARRKLKGQGLSALPPVWRRWMPGSSHRGPLLVGDWLKSWDVSLTADFLCDKLHQDAAILDMGCFCSEMLPVLHRAGFTRLAGADLNPRVVKMPYADVIDYRCEDFLHGGLPDSSQDAITSISVMEHGYDEPRLLAELGRLLRPGGYYLASFDYWPDKIDTGAVRFFDMSWTLFSREEVQGLIDAAGAHGLEPVGELDFEAAQRPIKCAGFRYTFAWLALRKRG